MIRSYVQSQLSRFFGLNISQVAPLLYVGGEFRADQWPQLAAMGIRAVLNLQAERVDQFQGTPPERTLHLLIPDFHPATFSQFDAGVAFIAAAHAEGMPVFVHCHAGVGRAPLMAAAYLVAVHHLSTRNALTLIRRARPIIAPNPRQVLRLREYEFRLRS
ncbi:dual specificity protein phosphatase family protein [Candidatus Oscillochloris fontis]|uniref:dual specificity protein phosphatase family protein n=1 Tax=Candidatus Oscillochloris fontis TaxID=2496868 RepID=UPI00101D3179|nr:dual specificity protein phosphatase [Candidatus Oscillochloris fontis]